ncbi:17670_t:CDS:2 [Acaulospora morrowiae]|uniref:17670_t:CDS:1 n=1 Tax=Acaulospora morrowiae TaxID=94023 RepID=A0A9N8ZDQ5_9GLOM|nr:17670_t:CDS:2 [Acaulospora morrowiae]
MEEEEDDILTYDLQSQDLGLDEKIDIRIEIEDEQLDGIHIVLSPKMCYAATWEHKDLRLWEIIEGQQDLREIEKFSFEDDNLYPDPCLTNISDGKHIVLTLKGGHQNNFVLFNLNTRKVNKPKAPNLDGKADTWNFLENDDFVAIKGDPVYRVYIFSSCIKDSDKWNCKKMIELGYYTQSYIFSNGKLLSMAAGTTILSQWNLKNLDFEQQYMLNKFRFRPNIAMNRDSTLLVLFGLVYKSYDKTSYKLLVYSMELGIMLAQREYPHEYEVYFIGTGVGERIIMVWPLEDKCEIIDPYSLTNPVDATKLFERTKDAVVSRVTRPYVIQSDRIVGWFEGNLYVQPLIRENWVDYLRNNLKDYGSIGSPYGAVRIKKMIDEAVGLHKNGKQVVLPIQRTSFHGTLLKWDVVIKENDISLVAHELDVKTKEWKKMEKSIFLLFGELRKFKDKLIMSCALLENENLAMATMCGIYVWTVKSNFGIRLHYFWDNEMKRRNFEYHNIINMLNEFLLSCNRDSKKFLPAIRFDLCMSEKMEEHGSINYFAPSNFRELIEDYRHEKMFLAHYGLQWIENLIKFKRDGLIEDLFRTCIELSIKNDEGYTTNLELLSIITITFPEISRNYAAYVSNFLSQIAFIVPFNIREFLIKSHSTLPHLHHYGFYARISKTTLFDIILSWILGRYKNCIKTHLQFHSFIKNKVMLPLVNIYKQEPNPTIQLIIPLPKFVTYPCPYNPLVDFIYPATSSFAKSTNIDLYKLWIGEALLNFKWNTYGRTYYLITWAIYTVYLCDFVITAILSDQISWRSLQFLLKSVIGLGIYHLIFELRQFIFSPLSYMSSLWNYLDLGAIIFPMLTSHIWLQDESIPIWGATISTLLLELKFLSYFRAIEYFGVYFAMIVGVARSAFSFLFILGFIIFAFANSLYLSLRPNNSDDTSSESLGTSADMFSNYFEAHVNKLREVVRKIQTENWQDLDKPFISRAVLNAIQVSAVESEELKLSNDFLKEMKASIQESKDEIKILIEELKGMMSR